MFKIGKLSVIVAPVAGLKLKSAGAPDYAAMIIKEIKRDRQVEADDDILRQIVRQAIEAKEKDEERINFVREHLGLRPVKCCKFNVDCNRTDCYFLHPVSAERAARIQRAAAAPAAAHAAAHAAAPAVPAAPVGDDNQSWWEIICHAFESAEARQERKRQEREHQERQEDLRQKRLHAAARTCGGFFDYDQLSTKYQALLTEQTTVESLMKAFFKEGDKVTILDKECAHIGHHDTNVYKVGAPDTWECTSGNVDAIRCTDDANQPLSMLPSLVLKGDGHTVLSKYRFVQYAIVNDGGKLELLQSTCGLGLWPSKHHTKQWQKQEQQQEQQQAPKSSEHQDLMSAEREGRDFEGEFVDYDELISSYGAEIVEPLLKAFFKEDDEVDFIEKVNDSTWKVAPHKDWKGSMILFRTGQDGPTFSNTPEFVMKGRKGSCVLPVHGEKARKVKYAIVSINKNRELRQQQEGVV